jgi:hypothetical protein
MDQKELDQKERARELPKEWDYIDNLEIARESWYKR